MNNDILVYDLECRTYGKPDKNKDRLRVFGCYSYKTNKTYLLKTKEDIQKTINAHKFLVGFNNIEYDNPILVREGFDLKYKIIIDLRQIFLRRAGEIKIKAGMLKDLLMEYSLDYISKTIGIVNEQDGKMIIDYKMFQKDVWSKEEITEICIYAKRDIEVTRKMYEWIENYFESFKPFITEEDINKKVYLTCSTAKFVYKAICKAMNWKEEYGDVFGEDDEDTIGGGYVSYPAGERFEGDIFCLDFNSLYPFIMIQCDLYGRKKIDSINERPVWNGGTVWNTEGVYYSDEMIGISKLLKRWFSDRLEYKKQNDRKEYSIKIILNTCYGILDNPYYVNTYDKIAAGDCTRIGRQWIKYARKTFKQNGYQVIYTDTDSLYIIDMFNNKEKLLSVKQKIIEDIKMTVPFPQSAFDMKIEDEIKYMYFFHGGNKEDKSTDIEMDEDDFINKPKGLLKKNYIYVTKDDRVIIKNLGIKKKSNSPLSRKIFWNYLVPEIKKGKIKFSKVYLQNLMMTLLEEDITLACMRKDVGNHEQYAKSSPNSLPAQISKTYGSGIHFVIPNTRNIGVGKGKRYCTLEEFKKNNLSVSDVDFNNFWSELNYFVQVPIIKNIFDFGVK